jgi:hypothetical protein
MVTVANTVGGSPLKIRGQVVGVLDPSKFANGVVEYLNGTETASHLDVRRYPGIPEKPTPRVMAPRPDADREPGPDPATLPFPRNGVRAMDALKPEGDPVQQMLDNAA